MSTNVSAKWTFAHDGSFDADDPVALPMQVVRFDPGLDEDNTAPGGVAHEVAVDVRRNPGAPDAGVESLKVEVSYDSGKTWQEAEVQDGQMSLEHPDSGSVSLRATVVDEAGGSVEQAIVDAYRLR
ncbi:MAG: hypothetical protein ACRDXX_13280 [Stackebrandtia sp.]